jgi:hypothetical protein
VIVVGVFLLDQRQRARDQAAEQDRQRRQEQEMEEQRDRELQVEDQRAQDAALQTYLDKMDEMTLRLHSIGSEVELSVQTLMRARTLTVLERLDGSRKRAIMRFLVELGLLSKHTAPYGGPTITLSDANLDRADLSGMDLRRKNLQGVRLDHANLSGANLEGTDSGGAILSHADLSGARLGTTEPLAINRADLHEADLSHADLTKAVGWTQGQLDSSKSLEGATMPDGSTHP